MLGLNLNSHQCRFRPSTTLLVANQIPLPTRNDLNSLESVSHFWFLPVIHCRHASVLFLGSQANKTGQGQARQTQHDSFLLLQIRSYSKRTPRLAPDSPLISNIHYRHWAALHTRCARGHPLSLSVDSYDCASSCSTLRKVPTHWSVHVLPPQFFESSVADRNSFRRTGLCFIVFQITYLPLS